MTAVSTRFVLIETSHAGNVGAVARAMKVMGFDDLVLVRPRWPDVLQRPEAIERASGADDVLARARVVNSLDEALQGMTQVCATVMTARDFGPPTLEPRAHFAQWLQAQGAAPRAGQGMALLFGCERYGMSNADVYRCHAALRIPTSASYGSLNLAAAVQLLAYDWRQAMQAHAELAWPPPTGPAGVAAHEPADAVQLAGMLAHWMQALQAIGFYDPAVPKKLQPRLQQLFNRARPNAEEVRLLRGIARAMQDSAQRAEASKLGD